MNCKDIEELHENWYFETMTVEKKGGQGTLPLRLKSEERRWCLHNLPNRTSYRFPVITERRSSEKMRRRSLFVSEVYLNSHRGCSIACN